MSLHPESPKSSPVVSDDRELPLGLLDNLTGYHLRRASAVFAADFNRALEDTGIRQVSFAVLAMIAEHPEASQGAIARVLGIQRANMVALIGDLLGRDLIERIVATSDRRAFALRLKAKGRKLLDECSARIAVHEEALLADLHSTERAALITFLRRVEVKEI